MPERLFEFKLKTHNYDYLHLFFRPIVDLAINCGECYVLLDIFRLLSCGTHVDELLLLKVTKSEQLN